MSLRSRSWAKEKGREGGDENGSGREEIKWREESIRRMEAKTLLRGGTERDGAVCARPRLIRSKIRFIYPLVLLFRSTAH
jgi:hypothetical protein